MYGLNDFYERNLKASFEGISFCRVESDLISLSNGLVDMGEIERRYSNEFSGDSIAYVVVLKYYLVGKEANRISLEMRTLDRERVRRELGIAA